MPKIEPKEAQPKMSLDTAVAMVNAAITEYRDKLTKIAKTEEGHTTMGYDCQMMVDPKEVAQILLNWEYPTYRILEEEAPQGMWDELGEHFGLESVSGFDL